MQKHSLILWPTLLVSLFLAACSHHDKGAKATAAGNSGASKSDLSLFFLVEPFFQRLFSGGRSAGRCFRR